MNLKNNNILLTALKNANLNSNISTNLAANSCHIRWRDKVLWISNDDLKKRSLLDLPALRSERWLVDCLKKSPITKICLAPELNPTKARIWTEAGQKARKKVYLRIPGDRYLAAIRDSSAWGIKRGIDFTAALLLLVILSPLMLAIAVKQKLAGEVILVKQQCVGKQGLLFETLQFPQQPEMTKFGFRNLPMLINVIRGEMSLVGRHAYSLTEALSLSHKQRKVLNITPGIMGTSFKQLSKTTAADIYLQDSEYLTNWSLAVDFKILLLNFSLALLGKTFFQKTV